MNTIDTIISNHRSKLSELLYEEATLLLELLSNEELIDICSKYPIAFLKVNNKTKEYLLEHPEYMTDVIDILIDTISKRNLTIDEYNSMTLDDVKDYLCKIIKDKTPLLYNIITTLENDSRISTGKGITN